jgi:hypothetical protein
MLQRELRIAIAVAESRVAIMTKRDAIIMLAMTQLERALENKATSFLSAT